MVIKNCPNQFGLQKMNDITKIKQLTSFLNECRKSYYNNDISIISDMDYDIRIDELKMLEDKAGFRMSNSPTQSVGYIVADSLKKVEHDHLMLSLDKTQRIDDLVRFLSGQEGLIMMKLDGLTISLHYHNGAFISAETRGDGFFGEDITHNINAFVNIPYTIPFQGDLTVDGEAIIDYDSFELVNSKLPDESKYKNPRNLASGSVRQLNSKIASERNIRFIAWNVVSGLAENSFSMRLCIAENLGFEVVSFRSVMSTDTSENISNYITELKAQSVDMRYPIDGMVISFDDVKYGNSLGRTNHHFKNQLAYKFYQDGYVTRLEDIEWNTTRSGQINPVAVFTPVVIDGTTVTRASLSNVSIVRELKLGIGDEIRVIKANQIIPKVLDNLTKSNTYELPNVCPRCGNKTVIRRDNGRSVMYCTSVNCPAKQLDSMVNFCSKRGMDICGLSEETIKKLIDAGIITDYVSIYHLYNYKQTLYTMNSFGKSSVDNLLSAIERSRHCKLHQLFVALGIQGIGTSAGKSLACHCFNTFGYENIVESFVRAGIDGYDWSQIDDFGEVTRESINSFIRSKRKLIRALGEELFIEDETIHYSPQNKKLDGITFCITGRFDTFSNRKSIASRIEEHGGKILNSVSSKTNYLISNDKSSTSKKNKAAALYGVKVLNEYEFMDLLNS